MEKSILNNRTILLVRMIPYNPKFTILHSYVNHSMPTLKQFNMYPESMQSN